MNNLEQHIRFISRNSGRTTASTIPGGDGVLGSKEPNSQRGPHSGKGVGSPGLGHRYPGPVPEAVLESLATLQTSIWLRLQFLLPFLPIILSKREQQSVPRRSSWWKFRACMEPLIQAIPAIQLWADRKSAWIFVAAVSNVTVLIIVMHEGHIIYQGPRDDVLLYFKQLGYVKPNHVDVADFLQEISTEEGVGYVIPGHKYLKWENRIGYQEYHPEKILNVDEEG